MRGWQLRSIGSWKSTGRVGDERAGSGISKRQEPEKIGLFLQHCIKLFALKELQRGGLPKGREQEQEYQVWEAGTPCPSPDPRQTQN